MAMKTKCQTPGALFSTLIHPERILVSVVLPFDLDLDERSAELLERNLHNALELVLARYFPAV